MSLAEPIVEGAYYLRECGGIAGPFRCGQTWEGSDVYGDWTDGRDQYLPDGEHYADPKRRLTRRVWITHTDPAEVVAELRAMQERATERAKINVAIVLKANALAEAVDLVAEKLAGKK